jgi:hypothetical protein
LSPRLWKIRLIKERNMTTKNVTEIRGKSSSKKLVLRKETLKDLTVKNQHALEVRGKISTIQRLGNNIGC